MKRIFVFLLGIALFIPACQTRQEIVFPAETWTRYADPVSAGWSADLLREAREFSDSVGVAGLMIVENGVVVDAWGDLTRRFMCHSVRKSFISALFGIQVDRGAVSVGETIASLGIDDKDTLTAEEKEATIQELLQARSGIYHPAAYETESMKASRPARGAHPHGTYYYYNNWDFNVLAHIYEMKTGTDVFTAFNEEIAQPTGMNDFRMEDTYFHLEPEHSIYPAYPFRMSTRDAARFGLLYLANGRWNEKQIVPESWVADSRKPWSPSIRPGQGYGYLWWVAEDSVLQSEGMYNAAGVGGQIIAVLPGADLVIVQRVNTYEGHSVPYGATVKLFRMILEAQPDRPARDAETIPMEFPAIDTLPFDSEILAALPGIYAGAEGDTIQITLHETGKPRISIMGQEFFLLKRTDGKYLVEDAGIELEPETGPANDISRLEMLFRGRTIELFPVSREVTID